jgi:DNA polymerase-3 subunit alpha
MLGNLDILLAYHKERLHGKETAQESLFGSQESTSLHTLELTEYPEMSTIEKLTAEKTLLGVYVSGHPLDAYAAEIAKRPRISAIKKETRNGIPVVTAGIIESVRELLTKKGDRMAFIALGDGTNTIEVVAFPEAYRLYHSILITGSCIAIQGKISIRNDESTVVIDRVKSLSAQPSGTEAPTLTQ